MERESNESNDPVSDKDVEAPASSGKLDDLIDQMRSRLLPGGPEVDYAALYAYIDRDLPDAERAEVERRVARWASWHDAYWTTQADLAAFEADLEKRGNK